MMLTDRILVFGLLTSLTTHCWAASCAHGVSIDGSNRIEFSGILNSEIHWGAPEFGARPETDSKFTAWIVSISPAISIIGGVNYQGRPISKVSDIQIEGPATSHHNKTLLSLIGKKVLVRGRLFPASSQADVTAVILAVSAVRSTDKSVCEQE